MARHKDFNWNLPQPEPGRGHSWESIHAALLMDIRDELKELNRLLRCQETQRIPRYLRRIASNTAKPRAKKP